MTATAFDRSLNAAMIKPFRPRGPTRLVRAAAAALVLASNASGAAGAATTQAVERYAALFETREIPSSNLQPFPKWRGMLERYFDERTLADAPCTSTTFNRCHLREWKAFLDGLEGLDRMTQIERVNRYMNEALYIIDPINYHVPDYWATPFQFFNKDGDCEDYAIAKFMSLRALGHENGDLRIVVLQDLNLRAAHAVLAVYVGGVPYVLDNQIPQVVPAATIRHYQPFYSINEDTWWLHRPR